MSAVSLDETAVSDAMELMQSDSEDSDLSFVDSFDASALIKELKAMNKDKSIACCTYDVTHEESLDPAFLCSEIKSLLRENAEKLVGPANYDDLSAHYERFKKKYISNSKIKKVYFVAFVKKKKYDMADVASDLAFFLEGETDEAWKAKVKFIVFGNLINCATNANAIAFDFEQFLPQEEDEEVEVRETRTGAKRKFDNMDLDDYNSEDDSDFDTSDCESEETEDESDFSEEYDSDDSELELETESMSASIVNAPEKKGYSLRKKK